MRVTLPYYYVYRPGSASQRIFVSYQSYLRPRMFPLYHVREGSSQRIRGAFTVRKYGTLIRYLNPREDGALHRGLFYSTRIIGPVPIRWHDGLYYTAAPGYPNIVPVPAELKPIFYIPGYLSASNNVETDVPTYFYSNTCPHHYYNLWDLVLGDNLGTFHKEGPAERYVQTITPEQYCDGGWQEKRCGGIRNQDLIYPILRYPGDIKCPPCTCLEAVNGDNVCCYGDDGKPLLHFNKPLFV